MHAKDKKALIDRMQDEKKILTRQKTDALAASVITNKNNSELKNAIIEAQKTESLLSTKMQQLKQTLAELESSCE